MISRSPAELLSLFLRVSAPWGGVEIERAWMEYHLFNFLSVRAGLFFTPYGIWNRDHGTPSVISVHRPFTISLGFFPEKQAGMEAYGKLPIGPVTVGYHLTLSNGRGPFDTFRDLDDGRVQGPRSAMGTP